MIRRDAPDIGRRNVLGIAHAVGAQRELEAVARDDDELALEDRLIVLDPEARR